MGAKQGKFLRWSDVLPKHPGPGGILSQGQDPDSHPTERHFPPFRALAPTLACLVCVFVPIGRSPVTFMACLRLYYTPWASCSWFCPTVSPPVFIATHQPAFSLPYIAVTFSATSVCMTYDDMFYQMCQFPPPNTWIVAVA